MNYSIEIYFLKINIQFKSFFLILTRVNYLLIIISLNKN